MRFAILTVLVTSALAALTGASLGGAGAADPREAVSSTPHTTAAKGPKLKLIRSSYGRVLADGHGQALYAFTKDTDESRCYGRCAKAWPPFEIRREVRAARGIDPDLIDTTERRNGSRQVTYDGQPLYFYAHEGPNQVLCHDVDEFGGTWLALKRSGRPAD
jgi:predicted lipoprotein with Yx(FWY)xxD motif